MKSRPRISGPFQQRRELTAARVVWIVLAVLIILSAFMWLASQTLMPKDGHPSSDVRAHISDRA
jgi:hypothetical protein